MDADNNTSDFSEFRILPMTQS